jgi:hypothetical protein
MDIESKLKVYLEFRITVSQQKIIKSIFKTKVKGYFFLNFALVYKKLGKLLCCVHWVSRI